MQPIKIVLLITMVIGWILLVVALATNYWLTRSGIFNIGLWKYCFKSICETHDFEGSADKSIKATSAMMLSAVLVQLVVIILAVLRMFKLIKSKLFLPIVILGFIASLFALIGGSIFTAEFEGEMMTAFDWSYALVWVFAGINLLTVVMTILLDKSDFEFQSSPLPK